MKLLLSNLFHAALFLAALALLLVLLHLEERAAGRFVAKRLGWRAVLMTGWLGVSLHELSHLLAALVFRHRVVAVSFFDPDPSTGTLGYVRHGYSRRSGYQLLGSFFIGVAPVVAGGAALAGILAWMIPEASRGLLLSKSLSLIERTPETSLVAADLRDLAAGLALAVWEGRTALLPLQLYLGICIASHLAPSPADFGGAAPGAALFAVLVATFAALCAATDHSIAGAAGILAPALPLLLATALFQAIYILAVSVGVRFFR